MDTCNAQNRAVALFVVVVLVLHGCSQTSHTHAVNPAYRPDSEIAADFVQALKISSLEVRPTIVRTLQGTSYSIDSQQLVVSLLNEKEVAIAVAKPGHIDPGPLKGATQWDIFLHDLRSIADNIKSHASDTRYSLVMEILLSPDNQSIWGIHCFVIDSAGSNAFSFLLNSNHKLFNDAKLAGQGVSEASRTSLIEKSTRVAVTALIQQVNAPVRENAEKDLGYSITSQKVAAFSGNVDAIFVIAGIQERLQHVFMHSLKHSLQSAFESNDIKAIVKLMPGNSNDYARFDSELEGSSPDAVMHIDLDPLYRKRKDGYQAVVGIEFRASVIDRVAEQMTWQATGKVDYIKMFGSRYTAHEGIRKEFAWHTTAAIVRTFMLDINGHESAPIYTVTEDRELYRQPTD